MFFEELKVNEMGSPEIEVFLKKVFLVYFLSKALPWVIDKI